MAKDFIDGLEKRFEVLGWKRFNTNLYVLKQNLCYDTMNDS